jgi:hypothetical protein
MGAEIVGVQIYNRAHQWRAQYVADILSSWGAGYKTKEVSASPLMGTMFEVPLQMTTAEATLPTLKYFLLAEKKAMKKLSHEAPTTQGQHGLRVYDDGAVWIRLLPLTCNFEYA